VGDIVGGNAFDVLFVCVADMAYRTGSLYGDANRSDLFLIALTLVLNVVLMLGLLGRQQKGPAKIGWEGVLVIALYLGGFYLLATGF
jgi:cation:H+ antiporter